MPLLFSYGTLREEPVQRRLFGRRLMGRDDALVGFVPVRVRVGDPAFAVESGRAEHAGVRPTERSEDRVPGVALEVTDEELAQADRYEPEEYRRILTVLASGRESWVYIVDATVEVGSLRGARRGPLQSQLYRIYEEDPAPIVQFLESLRERYRLPRPGDALDLGCGPGRLLAPLSRAGWRVTGMEPDPDYLAAARLAASSLEQTSVDAGGFLELRAERSFDLIAAVNGPFSYLLTKADRREALRRCLRALRPGGVLLLDLSNFPWILENYREPPVLEIEIDGVVVTRTARHEFDFGQETMTHTDHFQWTDAEGRPQETTQSHRMALVSPEEIEAALIEEGFDDLCTFQSYEDREPRPAGGKKLLIAARRTSDGARIDASESGGGG